MSLETITYIIISGIIALLLALFLYKDTRESSSKRLRFTFIFLRFMTFFSVLLLIVNPKFNQVSYYNEKPDLIIAIDNSSSITYLNQDKNSLKVLKNIMDNKPLREKFNIDTYTFGSQLKPSDSIDFSDNETNIDQVFKQLSQIYKNSIAPVLLITDGNQTLGNDYEYTAKTFKQPIYPIILGDTVSYIDLRIQQLNINKYAFLKNRFPVECILVYNGNNTVHTNFEVYSGNSKVYSEPITFSSTQNSKTIQFTLPANKVGVFSYKAIINPIDSEKNTINNSKSFAVEVIDQKTNIAIVSNFSHPDIGAFKKSIERNEQQKVTIIKPLEVINQINDFQLFILYQPNENFIKLMDALTLENKNKFIIAGAETDLNFLNAVASSYDHEITHQTEHYLADFNVNYAPFLVDNIDFESFPPLKSNFGDLVFNIPYETILFKKIRNQTTNQPLLATFEISGRREALLLGENIWQWRAQSFINNQSFDDFDDFIGKIIQYLSSNKAKERLSLNYESFYNGTNGVIFSAEFFDKNYAFDARESLEIEVKDSITQTVKTFPFILKNKIYQVDLSSLLPNDYHFVVRAKNENISKSGTFKILDYNVEQQFLNAHVTKLQQLATHSSGISYFISNTDSLVNDILNDNRYQSIQKTHKNIIPLIDWKYLLFLIATSLSLEWFIRKYNGLI